MNSPLAKSIGENIVKEMMGKSAQHHVLKLKDQVVTMESSSVTIGTESVEIDPQLRFQRLITAGVNSGELPHIFKYELCSYPPGLFQSQDLF